MDKKPNYGSQHHYNNTSIMLMPSRINNDDSVEEKTTHPPIWRQAMTNNKLSSAAERLIADHEVDPATVKQYLTVQTESKRKVERQLDRYKSFAKDDEVDNSVIKKYLTTAILTGADKISHEQAKLHAETQFETYRVTQDKLFQSDFDQFIKLSESMQNEENK